MHADRSPNKPITRERELPSSSCRETARSISTDRDASMNRTLLLINKERAVLRKFRCSDRSSAEASLASLARNSGTFLRDAVRRRLQRSTINLIKTPLTSDAVEYKELLTRNHLQTPSDHVSSSSFAETHISIPITSSKPRLLKTKLQYPISV